MADSSISLSGMETLFVIWSMAKEVWLGALAGGLIKGLGEGLGGRLVLGFAAKGFDDFEGGAELVEGLDFEQAGVAEVGDAFVGVFVEKCFEDGFGRVAVLGEVAFGFDLVGPIAAAEGWGIEGNVAD